MLFSSFEFIALFLPSVLLLFSLGVYFKSPVLRKYILILSSVFFYAWWSLRDAAILAVLLAFNYVVSLAIIRYREQGRMGFSRSAAAVGIVVNLSALIVFKYANLLVSSVSSILTLNAPTFNIVLPLGISFFTFQKIAFLVDSYKTSLKRQSFSDFTLFVSFFPQLIAGPIVHHREMMPQFRTTRVDKRWSPHLSVGLSLFIIGLAKKVLIADGLSPFIGPVFSAADHGVAISGIEAWGAALAYTLQLYFDFSGYSDMAIGLARCFGIVLPANFHSPYKAANIVSFWRRWHITLSRFLRDYIYIPLGGNRRGRVMRYANLFITMAIGGLWHGASWTFLVWGAVHGIALAINHLTNDLFKGRKAVPSWKVIRWALTMVFVIFGWVLFRAGTFGGAMGIMQSMVGLEGFMPTRLLDQLGPASGSLSSVASKASFVLSMRDWVMAGAPLIVIGALVAILAPNSMQIMQRYRPALKIPDEGDSTPSALRWRPTWTWWIYINALMIACVLKLSDVSEFLYFQF